ncbi:RE2, partial [Symbiodinium natans]
MRAEHELTHLPFRSWCESCVVGKGTKDFHQRRQEEKKEDVARYCIDYCFFTKALSQEAASTDAKDILEAKAGAKAVLVCRDQKSGALFTGVANSKGTGDPYSMAFALEGMKFCGHPDMIVVSDTEPAIKSLGEELVKRYPKKASSQPVPKGDHKANGAAERAVLELSNQVRIANNAHVAAMVISDRMIASAAKELEKPVYDEKTGKLLDPEKVKIGRMKEMTKMESFGVKGDITYDEAKAKGLRLVKSRWIDTEKEIEGKPGVRSRLVAQEVNTYKREDVSMGTPPIRVHRAVISHAATARPGESKSKKLIGRYDVSVAFFHADNSEKIGVIPPASEGTPNIIWELHKAMNGTREASRQWGVKIREVKTRHNFDELLLCPNTYYLKEHDLCLSCHGDDFLASGEREALDMLDKIMEENYEVKVLPRIGDPAHGGEVSEGRHLGRLIKWTGSGFTWECDPKFAPQVIEELELKGCKGVDTPASKATGVGNREVEKELSRERAEVFRRVTGTILYMAVDRPSLQYAASELAEGMSKPLEIHWLRLKRVGKYIAKYPVEKWHFELQEAPAQLESFSDSDWATDRRTRRSMSSTYQRFGKHLLDTSCGRQSLVALSSGEAEFYAMVKTAAEGKLTTEILRHFGWKVEHRVLSDSSAARSMAQRVGCGKVKHLSLKEMWIQQAVRNKELSIGKVDTLMNISDLGTKALEAARMDSLMKQLPLERGIVAAVVSCCLEKVQAAPVQSEEVWWLNLYLGLVHLLALVGLLFASYKGVEVLLKGWHWLCGRGNRPSVAQSSAAMALSRRDTPRGSGAEEAQHSAEVPTTRMPSVPEGTSVLRSPAGQSDSDRMSFRGDARTGVDDRVRVVRDTLSLLTVEELKSGLRVEGLQVTGLKQDLMERLLHKFDGGDESLSDRPSTKQLRYVLYIHRHRAQCRIQYENLRTREETSKWIANWKEDDSAAFAAPFPAKLRPATAVQKEIVAKTVNDLGVLQQLVRFCPTMALKMLLLHLERSMKAPLESDLSEATEVHVLFNTIKAWLLNVALPQEDPEAVLAGWGLAEAEARIFAYYKSFWTAVYTAEAESKRNPGEEGAASSDAVVVALERSRQGGGKPPRAEKFYALCPEAAEAEHIVALEAGVDPTSQGRRKESIAAEIEGPVPTRMKLIGNSLSVYWQARGLAALVGATFSTTSGRNS